MTAFSKTTPRSKRNMFLACLLAFSTAAAACGDSSGGDSSDEASSADATSSQESSTEDASTETSESADDGETEEVAEALSANLTDSCATGPVEGGDYFPDKTQTEYAENFTVSYQDNFKILTINEPFPGGAAQSYILVQCGTEAPTNIETPGTLGGVIEVPINGLLSSSTTHLPLIETLGRLDSLVGVGSISSISSEAVLASSDSLIEYAADYVIDTEVVLTAGADLLMTGGSDDPGHEVLRNAGLAVVANAEWLEPTPLGRAEWLKYMAVFFNEEAAATEQFAAIEAAYLEVVATAAAVAPEDRPLVTSGSDFGGTYYAPGGGSYSAQLIADAGGTYVWADNTDTASLEVDLEVQLEKAAEADIWINGSTTWTSLEAMIEGDPRYGEFAPQQNGQVWLYNRLSNENGSVDYFERGVTRPDLLLADLVKIFHPELAQDHEFEWYIQVGSAN